MRPLVLTVSLIGVLPNNGVPPNNGVFDTEDEVEDDGDGVPRLRSAKEFTISAPLA
jgi:hypothetical protein